jgi:hypothetical protein
MKYIKIARKENFKLGLNEEKEIEFLNDKNLISFLTNNENGKECFFVYPAHLLKCSSTKKKEDIYYTNQLYLQCKVPIALYIKKNNILDDKNVFQLLRFALCKERTDILSLLYEEKGKKFFLDVDYNYYNICHNSENIEMYEWFLKRKIENFFLRYDEMSGKVGASGIISESFNIPKLKFFLENQGKIEFVIDTMLILANRSITKEILDFLCDYENKPDNRMIEKFVLFFGLIGRD